MRLGIGVEEFDHIEVIGPVDGVAPDANAGGLAYIFRGELEDGFIGQSARA